MSDKKTSKDSFLLTVSILLIILDLFFWFLVLSQPQGNSSGRDARRASDMRQIVSAQEMYYGDTYKYVTSEGSEIPIIISTYLPVPPADPKEPKKHYVWIANGDDTTCAAGTMQPGTIKVGDWFCAYAALEKTGGTYYFVASQNGAKELTAIPTISGDCTCF